MAAVQKTAVHESPLGGTPDAPNAPPIRIFRLLIMTVDFLPRFLAIRKQAPDETKKTA